MCRRVFISGLLALWMTLPVMAQHLDIDSIDGGGSLNVAGVALDTTEDLLRDEHSSSSILLVDRSRTQFENWVIVMALGVCFTVGLLITVGTVQRGPTSVPTSIF
jgi:hypothetical protein